MSQSGYSPILSVYNEQLVAQLPDLYMQIAVCSSVQQYSIGMTTVQSKVKSKKALPSLFHTNYFHIWVPCRNKCMQQADVGDYSIPPPGVIMANSSINMMLHILILYYMGVTIE